MNFMERYFSLLIKRRVILFALVSGGLLILTIIFAYFMGDSPDPKIYNIFFLISSVVINVVAASLWYSLLVADKKLQRSEPLMKAFPFLKDKNNKIYIILASVPSATGHETTGLGEATGLGTLLESLHAINYPTANVSINFSSKYSDEEMENILAKYNVILLGGPNFNKFTKIVFEKNHKKFAYVFKKNEVKSNKSELRTSSGQYKSYLASIVTNTIDCEVVTYPEPKDVFDDIDVTKDCGLIARLRNDDGKFITILAGGMTPGVWVSAKLMTEYALIEQWYRRINPNRDDCEIEIVFETDVNNILSVEQEDINIIKATALIT